MECPLQIGAELLNNVAQKDLAHLFMPELESLHQWAIRPVRVPVGGNHSGTIGASNLGYVECRPAVAALGGKGHLECVSGALGRSAAVARNVTWIQTGCAGQALVDYVASG